MVLTLLTGRAFQRGRQAAFVARLPWLRRFPKTLRCLAIYDGIGVSWIIGVCLISVSLAIPHKWIGVATGAGIVSV